MKKRRSFSAEFKAKVALEALADEKTLSKLASKDQVHPNVIANWKKQAREELGKCFRFYNWHRPHSHFDRRRPMEIYSENDPVRWRSTLYRQQHLLAARQSC